MECRCTHVAVLHDSDAEAYASEHLRSDGTTLVCPDTGARWRVERHGVQEVLRQVDPERHLTQRVQH
jgi:hypothetical protein